MVNASINCKICDKRIDNPRRTQSYCSNECRLAGLFKSKVVGVGKYKNRKFKKSGELYSHIDRAEYVKKWGLKINAEDLNINGCYNMLGACIRLAIHDYHEYLSNKKRDLWVKRNIDKINSCEWFLFSENGLEDWINTYGFSLEIDYIRKVANKDINLRVVTWMRHSC